MRITNLRGKLLINSSLPLDLSLTKLDLIQSSVNTNQTIFVLITAVILRSEKHTSNTSTTSLLKGHDQNLKCM